MTTVKPKTHVQNYMKSHPPELPNMSGDTNNLQYGVTVSVVGEMEDNQAFISSKNGEQWANL